MTTGFFDASRRATVCTKCSATLGASVDEPSVRCGGCGQEWVPTRGVVHAAEDRAARPPLPRAQDESLRASVAAPFVMPPELARLWEGERSIPARRTEEALGLWAASRTRLLAGELERERGFVVLARELMIRASSDGDPARARALGEASLEAVSSPASRACLLGALVRSALRVGEVDAAERLLAAFDPDPSELLVDTELRVSAAMVAAARDAHRDVLGWLGANETEVVTDVVLTWLASLLRARALEALGRRGEAEAELRSLLARRPGALEALDHNLPRFPFLGAVEAWYVARREYLQAMRPVGELESEARVVVAIALALLGGLLLFAFYDSRAIDWMLFSLALLATVPLLGFGLRLLYVGRRQHRAFVLGRPAEAELVTVEPGLYGRGAHTKLTRVRLALTDPSAAPREAVAYRMLPRGQLARWVPGRKVVAFVDPSVPGAATITTPPA